MMKRCKWVDQKSDIYKAYHDNEWGVPIYDDGKLYEMFLLETFQAGLSWITILKKREAFRDAFDGFDVNKIANYDEAKVNELLNDVKIIRSKRKIAAAIKNAKIFIEIQKEFGTFSKYLWGFSNNKIIKNTDDNLKITSDLSDAISSDLKKRGMSFVGSITIYSYLQAIGIVNDHELDCFCYKRLIMNKKYLLFDLDGTLTNPMMGITKSVRYALNYYGIEVDDLNDLLPFIGPPLRDSFKEYYGFDEVKAQEAVEKYREYFSVDGLFDNMIYPGIEECLQALKDAGKVLLLATSKPEKFAKQILEHFDLAKYFTFIGGSEFNAREKKSEVIEYVLKTNNVDVNDAIMIGDRKHDIIGAHVHNLPCIGVLYGFGSLEELHENQADYIVESVNDLKRLLLNKQ